MHAFLLIGQSNMAGRGFLSDAVSVDTSRIYTLRMGRWQKMFRPINPDRSFSGVSLAESFAERYAQVHGEDVGLICCADGGTTLEQWMPGSLLYDNALHCARLAQRSATLAGILWHQGESDCPDGLHQEYREKLLRMLQALRQDLELPNVPILIGGLGDYLAEFPKPSWQLKNYPKINDALQSVSQELTNAAFVSAQGLTPNPDFLHFNAESLYAFGLRYFDVYEENFSTHAFSASEAASEDLSRREMELL